MAIYLIKDDKSTHAIISRTPFNEEELRQAMIYLESTGFKNHECVYYGDYASVIVLGRDQIQFKGLREVLERLVEILQPKFFIPEFSSREQVQSISEVLNFLK